MVLKECILRISQNSLLLEYLSRYMVNLTWFQHMFWEQEHRHKPREQKMHMQFLTSLIWWWRHGEKHTLFPLGTFCENTKIVAKGAKEGNVFWASRRRVLKEGLGGRSGLPRRVYSTQVEGDTVWRVRGCFQNDGIMTHTLRWIVRWHWSLKKALLQSRSC